MYPVPRQSCSRRRKQKQVLPHLFQHCTSDEEGVRNMVAECLGALTTMHPQRLVPELLKLPGDKPNPLTL